MNSRKALWIIVGVALFFAWLCFGQQQMAVNRARVAVAGGTSYLLEENFEGSEGAGFDLSDWTTDGGSPEVSTAGLSLEGDDCYGSVYDKYARHGITASADVWFYCLLRVTNATSASANQFIRLENSGGSAVASVVLTHEDSLMKFRPYAGGTAGSRTSVVLTNQTYHVWVHYTKGTGADSVCSVGVSTDGVRPTSGNYFKEVTSGDATTDCARVKLFQSYGTWGVLFDKCKVDDETIGDNP